MKDQDKTEKKEPTDIQVMLFGMGAIAVTGLVTFTCGYFAGKSVGFTNGVTFSDRVLKAGLKPETYQLVCDSLNRFTQTATRKELINLVR